LVLRTNPSLSHGVALTWIFHNLVRPLAPPAFAFVDHDLIPVSRFDIRRHLGDQPVYGARSDRRAFGTWALWAGYCAFDFARTGQLPLDFTTDQPLSLDTGGQNWHRLYRSIDPAQLRFADHRPELLELDDGGGSIAIERIDEWLHIGGVSHRGDARQRLDIAERVLAILANAEAQRNEDPTLSGAR
jgi:hypothetical protein